MTDRTARRLFDRVVRLSAARELTGLRSGCMDMSAASHRCRRSGILCAGPA
jgi:hypothetical protein